MSNIRSAKTESEDCVSSGLLRNFLRALLIVLMWSAFVFGQDNVATIIQRSVEANNRDWDAAPQFDYFERDQGTDGSKTHAITMIDGSPYERLVAINGKTLSAEKRAEEQKKFEKVVAERRSESPEKRSERISKYEAERKRDHTMLEQMTAAFDFKLTGEQKIKGRRVYVLRATPRKDYKPPNRDSQVMTGMEGKLWIDRATYQWVRVEAHVMHPVKIAGFLAEVEPGTQFELEKMPIAGDIWLATHFAMRSNARVILLFRHRSQEDETYFNYHKTPGPSQDQKAGAAK